MLNSRHYSGVAWVTLVAVVVGFQPWVAMAATPARAGVAAPKPYMTIPAARSLPASPARQYNTIPMTPAKPPANPPVVITPPAVYKPPTPGSVLDIKANSRISTTTPVITPLPLPTATPLSYEQLRDAAVKAEKNAQKSQLLFNQKSAVTEANAATFMAAVKQSGFSDLLNQPESAPKTDPKAGRYEVSPPKATVVTDKIGDSGAEIEVVPCNQLLGIAILSTWAGQSFKTSDGKTFNSYKAAKDYVLKADVLKNPIQVGKTGKISQQSINEPYIQCLHIKDMSAQLGFPKKFADKIALDDPSGWESKLQNYYVVMQGYKDAAQGWMAAESHLDNQCAKMILEAEAKDPKLEGLAVDAYGFWLATKLRYYYLFDNPQPMLPNEASIFDNLQIQKIFQGLASGQVDTSGYRAFLSGLYSSANGLSALLRLDRAFGFAAGYASLLKAERKLTERVAQAAAAAKAAASKAANASSSGVTGQLNVANANLTGKGNTITSINATNQAPIQTQNAMALNPIPTLDADMAALSDRAVEVFYGLGIPILDRTKIYGSTPLWVFVTNYAHDMDKYFFALKDTSKSFVVKNGGFDIYDSVAGWHKMQIEWHMPVKTTPQDFFNVSYPTFAKTLTYPADGSCPHVSFKGSDLFDICQSYLAQYRFEDSYLAAHPLHEVLSRSAKEQDDLLNVKIHYWNEKDQKYYVDLPASAATPKFLMGVTNAFGVSAATMLAVRGGPPGVYKGDKAGNLLLDLGGWKQNASEFSTYVEKGLQADKAGGYPYGTFSKQMQNFSSVAFLFHPISVGFGTCSIYETLFSPYGPHVGSYIAKSPLGYSCIDYTYPLLMLYMPDQPSKKTATLFRGLRRLHQWVEDLVIPNALAYSVGISEESGGSGGGGGTVATVVALIAGFFGSGSGSSSGGGGGSSGAKSATEIAAQNDAAAEQAQQKQTQASVAEANKVAAGTKAIDKAIDLPNWYNGSNCASIQACVANIKAVNNNLQAFGTELSTSTFSVMTELGKDVSASNSFMQAAYLQHELQKIGETLLKSQEFQTMLGKAQANAEAIVQNPSWQDRLFQQSVVNGGSIIPGTVTPENYAEKEQQFKKLFSDANEVSSNSINHHVYPYFFGQDIQAANENGTIWVDVAKLADGYFSFMVSGNDLNAKLKAFEGFSSTQVSQSFENYVTAAFAHELAHNRGTILALMGLSPAGDAFHVQMGDADHASIFPNMSASTGIPISLYDGMKNGTYNGFTDPNKARSLLINDFHSLATRSVGTASTGGSGAPTQ